MEQQIGVEYPVHATVGEQALYVLVQLVAHTERVVQFVDQFLLLGREFVGRFRVDGGEITVAHGVFLPVAHENFSFKINVLQLFPLFHVPFGAAVYHGSFELDLDNADGLVHLCDEASGFLVMPRVVFVQLRPEIMTGVVGVCFHGERGKRHQVDAVAVFQCGEVTVTERQAQHVGNATVVAGCRPHPKRVVVAPLYVEVVVIAQCVHDDVRSGAAVEDVAEDVQLVDAQALYQVADGADEFISPSGGHDGLDDAVEVGLFVIVLRRLVQQLLYDIGKFLRERLTHLGTRVFGRDRLTYAYELMKGDVVEIVQVRFGVLDVLQLLFGVINQGTELPDFRLSHRGSEYFVHLTFDIARRVFQNMLEGLVFPVYVGQEMFRAFGQVQNGLQVDDFRACGTDVGDALGEQFQKSHVVPNLFVGVYLSHGIYISFVH